MKNGNSKKKQVQWIIKFYYLLIVCLGVKRDNFAKRYEPYWHIISLGYFIGTATLGIIIDLYSEVKFAQGCWIAEYPKNCEQIGNCQGT